MKPSLLFSALFVWLNAVLSPTVRGQTFEQLFAFPSLVGAPQEAMILASDGNFYGTSPDGGADDQGIVFRLTPAGIPTVLYSFPLATNANGRRPEATLLEVGNVFYGLTSQGGTNGQGTAFRITREGQLTTLHHFNFATGRAPRRGLVLADDGNLYGVTNLGGANDRGVIFRLTPGGAVTAIYSFGATGPGIPSARLVRGSDGALYGSTINGNTIFRITTSGAFSIVATLTPAQGFGILAALAVDPDGNFYGVASDGGNGNQGTVFRVTPAGVVTVLHRFNGTNGEAPYAALARGPDGNFYGTTRFGGASDNGTLFRVTPAGAHTLLRSFTAAEVPFSGLVLREGLFYGVASTTIYTLSTAGAFTVLGSFDDRNQGAFPKNGLLEASDGNFYGTTDALGGVLFRLTPAGGYTVVHRFSSATGAGPEGALIQARDGHLYGVTRGGGANSRGTVYRFTLAGQHSVIHSFTGTGSINANGALVEGDDGNFYGALSQNGDGNSGSIYRVSPAGAFSIAHNFTSATFPLEGGNPFGPLLKLPDGDFIGTTISGGGGDGQGVVFRMTPAGALTVLARVPSAAYRIHGGLVLGPDGNYYGTTQYTGGDERGAFIRVTPAGAFNIVAMFGREKGETPLAAPVLGRDGNFYGTTSRRTPTGTGVVYRMTLAGVETVLRGFTGPDGSSPVAPLTLSRSGDLYGSTSADGAGGGGTLFRIVLNAPPITRAARLGAVGGSSTQLAAAKLLTFARDPEADAFTLLGVSAASAIGGTVTLTGGVITYTPATGFSGADSFTYTLRDSGGATSTGVVNVLVSPADAPSLNVVSITATADGFLLKFAGVPGSLYVIQFRNAMSEPWQTLNPPGPITAGPNGLFEFEDRPNPRPASRFYRAAVAP